jgi:hypothetical protein
MLGIAGAEKNKDWFVGMNEDLALLRTNAEALGTVEAHLKAIEQGANMSEEEIKDLGIRLKELGLS